jgi:hypothetical protein
MPRLAKGVGGRARVLIQDPLPRSGGSGTGSSDEFIFTPGAPQSGNVFGDWAQLMGVIVGLPPGSNPEITFTASFTIPLAGMPVGGWFQNLATWKSIVPVTGVVTITIPDGVKIDMLQSISNGLAVIASPTTDGVFEFSGFPPATVPWVLSVGLGAFLGNHGTAALILTPGTLSNTFVVLASFASQLSNGMFGPNTGPLVKCTGGDKVIGSQFSCGSGGGLPDGWVVGGGGAGAQLIYQNGVDSTYPLIPGWIGPAPIIGNGSNGNGLNYIDGTPLLTWAGPSPISVNAAIDRIAVAVAGLLGGPIP